MPFLESRSRKSSRLADEVLRLFLSRVNQSCSDSTEAAKLCSIYIGAVSLARLLLDTPLVAKSAKHMDRVGFFKLGIACMCPMVSVWCRQAASTPVNKKTVGPDAMKLTYNRVVDVAGVDSTRLSGVFSGMDLQYEYERALDASRKEDDSGVTLHYSLLFMATVIEAIEGRSAIDWSTQSWPVTSAEEYALTGKVPLGELMGGGGNEALQDFMLLSSYISAAGSAMFEAYEGIVGDHSSGQLDAH